MRYRTPTTGVSQTAPLWKFGAAACCWRRCASAGIEKRQRTADRAREEKTGFDTRRRYRCCQCGAIASLLKVTRQWSRAIRRLHRKHARRRGRPPRRSAMLMFLGMSLAFVGAGPAKLGAGLDHAPDQSRAGMSVTRENRTGGGAGVGAVEVEADTMAEPRNSLFGQRGLHRICRPGHSRNKPRRSASASR